MTEASGKHRVLVTGAAGYIGSVLVRQLLAQNYLVRGLDILKFGGTSLLGVAGNPNFEFVNGDVRKESDVVNALHDVDAVIHLAAIVGDPACSRDEELAEETNWMASKLLFDLCNATENIERFVFASTCSNYGKMSDAGYVTEDSPLKPISHYAKLKVRFEKYLLGSQVRDDFIPTSLRFATVHGISPRMRFDLTVNEFIRDVSLGKELLIYGEQFWRPYCHVDDLARSTILVLMSEADKVRQDVFGVGNTGENYQKKMIAEEIVKVVPSAKIKYVDKDEDPRDYRVDFSKIRNMLGFETTRTVPDTIRGIHQILRQGLIADPFSQRFQNC